jgi:hypothetical protein
LQTNSALGQTDHNGHAILVPQTGVDLSVNQSFVGGEPKDVKNRVGPQAVDQSVWDNHGIASPWLIPM